MNRRNWSKQVLCLGLALLLLVALAACQGQAEEQDGTPPTETVTPAETPEPEPTAPIPYADVAEDSPYYDVVVWAYQNGIAPDGDTFEPDSVCTRAELIDFIWRAMGSPALKAEYNPFDDVSSGDWFYESALWAYRNDVIPGSTISLAGVVNPIHVLSGSTFHPDDPCTNAQALTFLWRAEGRPMAVTASDEYYARAMAWAENGGLFDGTASEFDPDAPCTRAGLMTYLYWAVEQWTYSEEDKTVQTEYKQVIDDAYLLEATGSVGLFYADYLDVDGDGETELFTMEFNVYENNVTAAVYANRDGHVRKTGEKTFVEIYRDQEFFTCWADGQLYLCLHDFSGTMGETYDYYRVENGAITFCEQASVFYREATPESDTAIMQKYTQEKSLFLTSGRIAPDRGLLPSAEEYYAASDKRWLYYWAESDPQYAAAMNGDFSAFAGNYREQSGQTDDITFSKDGIVTGGSGYFAGEKPFAVDVGQNGVISCYVGKEDFRFGGWNYKEVYSIYPVGVSEPYNQSDDPTQIRMKVLWFMDITGEYVKVS